MNLYDELGVDKNAKDEQIKEAYREKAKEAHPDKPGGSHERMQALVHAYDVLKSKTKRHRYDKTGDDKETPFDHKLACEIQQIFIEIIDRNELGKLLTTDLMAMFRHIINCKMDDVKKQKQDNQLRISKFKKVLAKVVDDGKITHALKMNITDMELKDGLYDEDVKFYMQVSEVLADYRYTFDVPEPEPEITITNISWNSY